MKQTLTRTVSVLLAAGFLFALVHDPGGCAGAVRQGLSLCLSTLIPALFPFFVAGGLLVRLGAADRMGRLLSPVMGALFRLPGAAAAALSLGFLGGYPSGARVARGLYERGSLTRDEAERLLAFCNNAGPAFFVGLVGPLLGSAELGVLLFLAHALSALLIGLLFRGRGRAAAASTPAPEPEPLSQALPRAVEDALRSLGRVCGMVLLARCAAALLRVSAPLLLGLLEVSSGVLAVGAFSAPTPVRAAVCAFLLGFGGLSVHAQTLAELRGSGLSLRRHTLGKVLHGLLSAGVSGAVFLLLPGASAPAFAGYAPIPWHLLPHDIAMEMITASIKLDIFVLFLLLLPILFIRIKNCWKNRRRSATLNRKYDP